MSLHYLTKLDIIITSIIIIITKTYKALIQGLSGAVQSNVDNNTHKTNRKVLKLIESYNYKRLKKCVLSFLRKLC